MLFLMIFLAGMAAGAGLAYHFANMAMLKQRLAEMEQSATREPPAP